MAKTIGTAPGARSRAGWLAWGIAQAAALAVAVPAWAADSPAGNAVIGHAAADRSGAAATWILPEGVPYLFVPYVGAEVGGAVAAVESGADVGAVLFQRPYFGTHDAGCVPGLGSDSRPDLKWRGATARFSPPAEAPAGDGEGGDGEAGSFASLIVYRKDLGPPPGVLLLNRRLTLGSPCLQAVHKTYFDRVFIPLAPPPEPARCYNLAGTYPQRGGKDIRVAFAAVDRLALLQPADLDDRYRGLRHRFRAILFDAEGCRGNGGEFRSAGKEPGDIMLEPIGLRDKVRSVRIVYDGGPLAPYYAAPPPPVAEKPAPPPTAPTAAPTAAAAAPAEPMPAEPVPAQSQPGRAESAGAESAGAESAGAESEGAESEGAKSEGADPAQIMSAEKSTAGAGVGTGAGAGAAPPSQPVETDAPPLPRAQTATLPLFTALPAPRLKLPPAAPPAPAPAAARQTFEYPVHEIYRLNFCLRWGVECGEPAATAWCQAQGFAKASAWTIDKDIGSLFPTIVLADSRVCAQSPCDGFAEITCSN